ncbi:EamA family transporter [bacterium]|nr:EamA family transporter [bacterium]
MSGRDLALLFSSIVLGASGQLMFKAASRKLPPFSELGLLKLLQTMFSTPLILAGFACFFISALLWIIALKNIPLSVAYPMVALSYVIIFAGSATLFAEPLGWRHGIGALLIVCGIWLIAGKG